MIIKAVAATLTAISREVQELFESSNSSNNDANSASMSNKVDEFVRWNATDIEFFDSNYDEKSTITEEVVIHADKNTYYRDVHIFMKRVKKMIMILSVEKIRKNLSTCLRDTTLIWHIAKLSNTSRRLLSYEEDVDE